MTGIDRHIVPQSMEHFVAVWQASLTLQPPTWLICPQKPQLSTNYKQANVKKTCNDTKRCEMRCATSTVLSECLRVSHWKLQESSCQLSLNLPFFNALGQYPLQIPFFPSTFRFTLVLYTRRNCGIPLTKKTGLWTRTWYSKMTTAALPPLDPLFRRNAKRTRDIFASCPDDSLIDEEKRWVTSSE